MKRIVILFYFALFMPLMSTAQSVTSVILPQYIQGNTGTNSNRIPFAYRVRITGLTANSTYRFFNQVVVSTDGPTSNGAGNCIFVTNSGDFVRTTDPTLATAGRYGTFTTNEFGEYEGWFITEPTASATRFIPGKYVFMRINLNDGQEGTSVATRLTTTDSVKVVKLDAVSSDSTGTGIRCTSTGSAKDFVFLYDNIDGTGRPISGTFIENDGTANTINNNYSAFYGNYVNGVDGAFGAVIPNILPNGIRRVEQRSLSMGNLVAYANDSDGIWPSGANTIDPTGGTTEIVLAGSDVQFLTCVCDAENHPIKFNVLQNYPNPFNPITKIIYQISKTSYIKLSIHNVLGCEVALLVNEYKQAGTHTVIWNADKMPSGVYFARLQDGKNSTVKKMLLTK